MANQLQLILHRASTHHYTLTHIFPYLHCTCKMFGIVRLNYNLVIRSLRDFCHTVPTLLYAALFHTNVVVRHCEVTYYILFDVLDVARPTL